MPHGLAQLLDVLLEDVWNLRWSRQSTKSRGEGWILLTKKLPLTFGQSAKKAAKGRALVPAPLGLRVSWSVIRETDDTLTLIPAGTNPECACCHCWQRCEVSVRDVHGRVLAEGTYGSAHAVDLLGSQANRRIIGWLGKRKEPPCRNKRSECTDMRV